MYTISINCDARCEYWPIELASTQYGSVHFCSAIVVTEQLQWYLQPHWRADGCKYQPMTEELHFPSCSSTAGECKQT